jgi:peptidoglycan-associated lipoprotein
MHRLPRLAPALALSAAALAAAACHRRREEPAPAPTPVVNQDSIDRENARRDSIARAERMRADSLARERARADSLRMERERADRAMSDVRNAIVAPIYFDFDRSDLRDDARGTLDAKLPLLTANAGVRLRVAGHTDERGSDEYNMALGQRRAAAAKRYLSQHGVDAGRVETVSFGEEQPTCTDHDESCWSRNRRDEFAITAGGDNLTVPRP